MTKISPPAHNYSINTLGGEDLTATETGCHLYPAHASKDYFKSFLAQGKISPRNKFKGWVFQMPHHSGKCSVYWKWPNQSYFLGNALPMSPLQHNFSPMEGAEADWPMVHTALCMQKLSSTLIFTTPVLGMKKRSSCPMVVPHWATSAGNIQPFPAQQLWAMLHKYWYITSRSQSTREDWTPVLLITHRSNYWNKFQEITIIPSSSWHCKQNT